MTKEERSLATVTAQRILRFLHRSKLGLFIRELLKSPAHIQLYLAGGTVRDFAEGARVTCDIDLMVEGADYATIGEALVSMKSRGTAGVREILPQGSNFGVYKIVLSGVPTDIDIALAREEVSTGSGHRDFIVTMEGVGARGDSSRRDFSMNALFFRLYLTKGERLSGQLVDFQGGLASLLRKEIRAVGVPRERFHEDPLRMLRALRQKNERRGFTIEEKTWNAICELMPQLIHTVPAERVVTELLRALKGSPMGALNDWKESGALAAILPEVDALDRRGWDNLIGRFSFIPYFLGARKPSNTLLLSALLVEVALAECQEKIALESDYTSSRGQRFLRTFREASFYSLETPGAVARRGSFPGIQDIMQMIDDLMKLLNYKTLNNRRAVAERILKRNNRSRELLALYQAHQKARMQKKVDFDFLIDKFSQTIRHFDGNDFLKMGIKPGPHLQMIMDAVREEELWDRLRTHDDAIKFALKLFHEEFETLNCHLSLVESLLMEGGDAEPSRLRDFIGHKLGTEILQLFHSNTLRLLDSYRARNLLQWVFTEFDDACRKIPAQYNETMKGLDLILREEEEVSPGVVLAFTLREVGRNAQSESMRRLAGRSAAKAAQFLKRMGAHTGLIDDVVFLISNIWMFLLPRYEEMVKLLVESTRDDLISAELVIANYMLKARFGRIPADAQHYLSSIRRNRTIWRMQYLKRRADQRFRNLFLTEDDLLLPREEGGLGVRSRQVDELQRQLAAAQEKGAVKDRGEALRFVQGLSHSYEEWAETT